MAVFNVGGEIYALDGLCSHQGGPLGKGRLEGDTVVCPWHGRRIDVRTGRYESVGTQWHPRLETRVTGDDVFVYVNELGSP